MVETKNLSCLWFENDNSLECQQNGSTVFKDTQEHWKDGFCRLLKLSNEEAKQWIEGVALTSPQIFNKSFSKLNKNDKVLVLKKSIESFPKFVVSTSSPVSNAELLSSIGVCGHKSNTIWESGIGKDNDFVVVGCKECEYGWLINANNPKTSLNDTTLYNETYFEGKEKDVGYGSYLSQKDWRIEKSHRLTRQIQGICSYLNINLLDKKVLDIGSSYGFTRKAFDEAGFKHDGIELSKYAAEICEKEFGFKTFVGTANDFEKVSNDKYTIVTMFDILEHVSNPLALLGSVKNFLNPDGICVIRTPNLMAIEREIFGRFYHSLKYEHLHYFSPKVLISLLEASGLQTLFLASESHLLKGFFEGDLNYFSRLLKGSDLFLVACNKSVVLKA
ncbi:MAG: class I SAM-dependent methyltransferase [Candidatus Melainabacteria bacterium]|nr:class I SAM-dependent methyltransferase [Candidatus Melainabacteria bacterium]